MHVLLVLQVRLCLAKKDYIRAQILARKISPRAFQKQQGDSKGEIGIEGTAIEEADAVRWRRKQRAAWNAAAELPTQHRLAVAKQVAAIGYKVVLSARVLLPSQIPPVILGKQSCSAGIAAPGTSKLNIDPLPW